MQATERRWSLGYDYRLVRPDSSVAYKAQEAMRNGSAPMHVTTLVAERLLREKLEVFLVQHRWADVFYATEIWEGDLMLPFPVTAFEFLTEGGLRAILVVLSNDDGTWPSDGKSVVLLHEHGHGTMARWGVGDLEAVRNFDRDRETDLGATGFCLSILAHARAMCIALDAGLVDSQSTPAPQRLNKARGKQGRPPVNGYRTVHVMRSRDGGPSNEGGEHGRVRLHVRRGFMRFAGTPKATPVRWCLVGNPDLGFIDKLYRA